MRLKPFSPLRIATVLALAAGVACRSCALSLQPGSSAQPAPPVPAAWLRPAGLPARDASWTSTRDVSGLLLARDGSLWAATRGGVLRRDTRGSWRKWTRRDGLPSHEARALEVSASGQVSVLFPLHRALWKAATSTWEAQALPAPAEGEAPAEDQEAQVESKVLWRGKECVASLDGLKIGARRIALPPSEGTHISALLAGRHELWAALFGDGLWKWDGKSWSKPGLKLPAAAREVTALAGSEANLWLGTRRAGVWHLAHKIWTQHVQGDEPFDVNVQSLILFRGVLWASTLEDGLQARVTGGWKHFGSEALSSDAPRQMAVFQSALYVRHGGGEMDRFDGSRWARNVFPWLPRHKALGLSAGGGRLVVAQWGGWSEWDGARWAHFFPSALANLPLLSLLRDDKALWIGTQSRGLAQWNSEAAAPQIRWHDERAGLGDDWITALARSGPSLAAGTFVGGLSLFDGKQWSPPILDGENVTALEDDARGGFFIATRHGSWHRTPGGSMATVGGASVDGEAQALLRQGKGLWIGTRTGLFWVADAVPQATPEAKAEASGGRRG